MVITSSNDALKDQDYRSYSENNELNRTFVSMRNNLREDLKGIHDIEWHK